MDGEPKDVTFVPLIGGQATQPVRTILTRALSAALFSFK
jgi:hypothetical protein